MHEIEVQETRDVAALRAMLAQNPFANGYMLADLDPPYFDVSRWWVARWRDQIVSVLLVYEGLSEPALLSAGAPDGVAAIFEQAAAGLPPRGWAKLPPGHAAGWQRSARLSGIAGQWMMGVRADGFRPAPEIGLVRRLSRADDLAAIERVYTHYPDHFFEASQLDTGAYFGAWIDGELVSVAGTHALARASGVSVLGNIVTAAPARGRGIGAGCTSRLLRSLFDDGIGTVALQVDGANVPAVACYRRLGFVYHSDVLQCRYELARA